MSDSGPAPGARFKVDVAVDRLSATLSVTAGPRLAPAEVLASIRELKFKNVDEVSVAAAVSKEITAALSIVIAKGLMPVDERPGKLTYRVPVADSENGIVAKVEAGKVLAVTGQAQPGTDGRDVLGQPVAHRKGALAVILGQNIVRKKDEVISEIAGNLRLREGRLSVERLLELDGDEDSGTLQIVFEGDVAVKGSLRDGRTLHVTNSLVVGNAVSASHLKIGGDAMIKGGIVGKDKGKCVVGGELRCGFITGSSIVAGGSVHSQSEILNSRIFCSGKLQVTRGPITGGEISANGGVVCQTLGSSTGTPTTISAGIDRVTKSLLAVANAEADSNRKRIGTMRAKITPLMEKLKSLTPEQREKVTELLYEADELESKNQSMLAELAKRCELMNQRAKAEIAVTEMIYPGVKIRLPGVETLITTTIQGPLKVSLRQNGEQPEIVIFQESSRSTYVLPSQRIADVVAKPAAPLKSAA